MTCKIFIWHVKFTVCSTVHLTDLFWVHDHGSPNVKKKNWSAIHAGSFYLIKFIKSTLWFFLCTCFVYKINSIIFCAHVLFIKSTLWFFCAHVLFIKSTLWFCCWQTEKDCWSSVDSDPGGVGSGWHPSLCAPLPALDLIIPP